MHHHSPPDGHDNSTSLTADPSVSTHWHQSHHRRFEPVLPHQNLQTPMQPAPFNPRLQRSSSFGSATPSRSRAGSLPGSSSLNPDISAAPRASTRRRNRANDAYLDPDAHWLSEDEGTSQGAVSYARGPRNAPADSPPPDLGEDDKRKDGTSQTTHSTTETVHPIHQRPSDAIPTEASLVDPKSMSSLPSVATIIKQLLAVLRCPICCRALRDATTLACGHTVCHSCIKPPIVLDTEKAASIEYSHSSSAPSPTPSSHSSSSYSAFFPEWFFNMRRRVTGRPYPDGPPTGGILGHVAPSPTPSSTPPTSGATMLCPIVACTARIRSSIVTQSYHIDVVLQKIVTCIRLEDPARYEAERQYKDQTGELAAAKPEEQGSTVRIVGEDDPDHTLAVATRYEALSLQDVPETEKEKERGSSDDSRNSSTESAPAQDGKRGRKDALFQVKKRIKDEGGLPELAVSESSFTASILSELECQVCANLFFDPLTTPCGHTFCKTCLQRSIDHSDKCPLCRADLPGHAYIQNQPSNEAIFSIISKVFPDLYTERKEAIAQEIAQAELTVPIFVCALSFPQMPTFLHVFEPRYRLMMRRAMDSNRRFGMVLQDERGRAGHFHEYGTMLEITSLELLDDGRSVVETMGIYRFKVLEAGIKDGYAVGRIERIEDVLPEEEAELERLAIENALPNQPELSTQQLMAICTDFLDTMRAGASPVVIQRLNNTNGPQPTAPSEFTFWMTACLPIEDHEKAKMLQITSTRLRMQLLVYWIGQIRTHFWFNRGGCITA